jgi:aspartate/methionine/tyrosine aminotransferase
MYILPEFQQEYNDKIALGKKYLQNKKIVVAPKRWFGDNNINTADLIPTSWIKL